MPKPTLNYSTPAEILHARTPTKAAQATFVLIASDPVAVLGDLSAVPADVRGAVDLLAKAVRGKPGETTVSVTGTGGGTPPAATHRVVAVGVGPLAKVGAEELRRAGANVYRTAKRARLAEVAVVVPSFATVSDAEAVEAVATGALLSAFDYAEYVGARRAKEEKDRLPVRVQLVSPAKDAKPAVDRARVVGLSTNFARTVASRPGNDINPVTLADVAKSLAKQVGLTATVLDEKQLAKLSMGGLLGVGGGSATPPRLIALEHKPAKVKNPGKPLLIVGKSITFDTGGVSIKPADRMQKMIYDKCGGMAVLGLMHALAQLKTPVHVVGVLTSAENHVGSRAYRPGDILRMYNGITVEITNTDAEGRLVLGDAIAWGIEKYKPAAVVDLATLTGGVVVALGTTMAGLFSNNDRLAAEVTAAATAAGEKLWRLPVGDDQRDMLKSDLADVVNSAGRYASPLTGAAFVSLFVPPDDSVPWAHLDIAGVADTDKELPYLGKGATGFGIRSLLNWVEHRAQTRA